MFGKSPPFIPQECFNNTLKIQGKIASGEEVEELVNMVNMTLKDVQQCDNPKFWVYENNSQENRAKHIIVMLENGNTDHQKIIGWTVLDYDQRDFFAKKWQISLSKNVWGFGDMNVAAE